MYKGVTGRTDRGVAATLVAKLDDSKDLDGDGTSDDGDKSDSSNTGDRVKRDSIHFGGERGLKSGEVQDEEAPKSP